MGADGLGDRLRATREGKGISLRELARRVGVSASLISQIETGKVNPSVSTLYSLASELEASVDALLFADTPRATKQPTSWADLAATHPPMKPVQRAGERQMIQLNSGVQWERLTTESVPGIDFLHVVYEPGGQSSPHDEMQRHAGREWGFVVEGTLQVSVAFDTFVLEPGDAIAFDSTVPHRFYNHGDKAVKAVWFVLGWQSEPSVPGDRPHG